MYYSDEFITDLFIKRITMKDWLTAFVIANHDEKIKNLFNTLAQCEPVYQCIEKNSGFQFSIRYYLKKSDIKNYEKEVEQYVDTVDENCTNPMHTYEDVSALGFDNFSISLFNINEVLEPGSANDKLIRIDIDL